MASKPTDCADDDCNESGSNSDASPAGDEAMELSSSQDHPQSNRQKMLAHLAVTSVCIKSQQRGEEDLTPKEKLSILSELLDHKPAIFLERFHARLRREDLECFQSLAGDYEVDFYLKEARRKLSSRRSQVGVRNRRYEAIKKLEREGTYFDDAAMKDRDPLMFEEYIGQYMSDEERKGLDKAIDPTDLRLSNILMTFMDEQETKELYKRQKEEEDDMIEEEDDDDEDEEGDEDKENDAIASTSQHQEVTPSAERKPTPASAEERALMRQEFLQHMHLRFLSGQEKNFDYSAVDGNDEYDSLALRTQDEEEEYFDDDDEES